MESDTHRGNPQEPYRVSLQDVFEGPMDLLLYLVKKNELDIYDIPIALITDQFLAYIQWLKLVDVDYAGDFLVMAATLAQIKSKSMLPIHGIEEEEAEDPRLEIARPLAEYIRIKTAAERLAERNLLGEHTFTRKPVKEELAMASAEEVIKVGLFELIDAFQQILKKTAFDQRLEMSVDRITVKDRINEMIDILEAKGTASFDELLGPEPTKSDIIVTFLATLEMVKLALVRVVQHVQTGAIRLFYQ